ncbi:MAG: penicillin-binding protein 1A [Dokdonella sp.]
MRIPRLLRYALYLALAGVIAAVAVVGVAYWLIMPGLPSVETLKDTRLQVPLRVYSSDGKLMATFGETRRIPVVIEQIPAQLQHAFVSAEDADFYTHGGLDFGGIMRAVWLMVTTGSKHVAGGSTITQQVARNFFLSSEVTFTRKISEMFLALKIENALSKDEILTLYLNKAFFGNRAYGIAAAAEFYYGKTLDQLSLPESAMLASLPKFPSTGNPLANRTRATQRRDYVLGRMFENKYIDADQLETARREPDLSYAHEPPIEIDAAYLAEMVRQQAIALLGNEAMDDGYVIHTTIQSPRQEAANAAVRDTLLSYDRRHGWRGTEGHVDIGDDADVQAALSDFRPVAGLIPGLVTQVDAKSATVQLSDGQSATLDLEAVSWARPQLDETRRGAAPKSVDAVLKRGDVVRLARATEETWTLSQLPKAQGALVSLDVTNGAVLALVGGFNFQRSKFNRVVQSARNPGSSFKPFVYSAAFDHGFTPASIVNDAPLSLPDPSRPNGVWSPSNDNNEFRGPVRLREALTRSINLVSVRLLDAIGVRYARTYIQRFGIPLDHMPANLSLALGTASVSPLDMVRAYSTIANGGYLVDPFFISEIVDRDGKVVYAANPGIACRDCPERNGQAAAEPPASSLDGSAPVLVPALDVPATPRLAPRTLDPRNDFLITSLMRDVVRRGTGAGAMVLKRNDLAGKTGTTNDHRDAWFSGFNDQIATTVWTGFDDFGSLGNGEFASKAALPIWIEYMREALKDMPEHNLDMPSGIVSVLVNRNSGYLADAGDPDAMSEFMKSEDVDRLAAMPRSDLDETEQHEAYDVF